MDNTEIKHRICESLEGIKIKEDRKEYSLLRKKGYNFTTFKPKVRTKIDHIIMFVSDTRKLHDSGYPFIRMFGAIKGKDLIDLGWHDHCMIETTVNIDSIGKNMFRIISWGSDFWITGNNIWCSSFTIKGSGELS